MVSVVCKAAVGAGRPCLGVSRVPGWKGMPLAQPSLTRKSSSNPSRGVDGWLVGWKTQQNQGAY